MDDKIKISENIKKHRKIKGLTQNDIAEIIEKDRSTVAKYESGQADPPFNVLIMLAKLFDITIDELCGIERQGVFTVRSEDEIDFEEKISCFTKEEQIMIYKIKVMEQEKKKKFMKIFEEFIKDV